MGQMWMHKVERVTGYSLEIRQGCQTCHHAFCHFMTPKSLQMVQATQRCYDFVFVMNWPKAFEMKQKWSFDGKCDHSCSEQGVIGWFKAIVACNNKKPESAGDEITLKQVGFVMKERQLLRGREVILAWIMDIKCAAQSVEEPHVWRSHDCTSLESESLASGWSAQSIVCNVVHLTHNSQTWVQKIIFYCKLEAKILRIYTSKERDRVVKAKRRKLWWVN